MNGFSELDVMSHFILLLLLLMASCSTNKRLHNFDMQGHRGCRGLMPENTIPAMIKAIDLGVTTLEMDIAFSSDKHAILSHEPFFNHEISTRPDGSLINENDEHSYNLYQIPYAEIKMYDVGLKTNPRFPKQQKMKAYKPLLSDVIDSVENYTAQKKIPSRYYNIETKTTPETDNIYHPAPPEFVDLLMKTIDSKNIRDRAIIQSFDIRTLQYLHQKYPGVQASLLIEPAELTSVQTKLDRLGFKPDIVSPEYHMVNSQFISHLHKQNIRVIPWTVNDKSVILDLKELGVDGIITDYPDLFDNK
jgi:glycerophosphoryl diester phosphodiesterase